MNQITGTIQNIFSDRPLQEDEYRNESDNLIHCAKCKTPRQHHVVVLGKEMVVPIRCRCQQEVQDKEEAERKHREFLDQVSRLKANGLQDKSLREYTFANDKGYNPEMQKAHDYVVHWSEMKAKSIGLLLWGDVGTGKSFFAGCIANALLEQGVPVLMTNFSRILNALSGLYSEEKNQYIDSLNQYSLLIIDDLGIERSTEFALEQVFNVIDSRYRSKLPLIVTTNMTLEELKNPQDLTRSRIYDRVLERCVPLRINNQNSMECADDAAFSKFKKEVKNLDTQMDALEQAENKFTAELDRTLERYRDLEKTVADVDAGELTDTRMELRTGKEQSAASQLQKIYGVKYDYDMMRQSKLEVKKMLGEVTRKPSITQMLQRKEPESQMQKPPKRKQKDYER